jgi:hypothetical protein
VRWILLCPPLFTDEDGPRADKHGLVNKFSRVLEQNGINHMYSSTFKTANLFVSFSFGGSPLPDLFPVRSIKGMRLALDVY